MKSLSEGEAEDRDGFSRFPDSVISTLRKDLPVVLNLCENGGGGRGGISVCVCVTSKLDRIFHIIVCWRIAYLRAQEQTLRQT